MTENNKKNPKHDNLRNTLEAFLSDDERFFEKIDEEKNARGKASPFLNRKVYKSRYRNGNDEYNTLL